MEAPASWSEVDCIARGLLYYEVLVWGLLYSEVYYIQSLPACFRAWFVLYLLPVFPVLLSSLGLSICHWVVRIFRALAAEEEWWWMKSRHPDLHRNSDKFTLWCCGLSSLNHRGVGEQKKMVLFNCNMFLTSQEAVLWVIDGHCWSPASFLSSWDIFIS